MTSLGKMRRFQQCATQNGHFVIMAVDHRDNLQGYLQQAHPKQAIGYDEMVDFKQTVTETLRGTFSAALLDPQFGAAQSIMAGQMPGNAGLIVSVEKWGYSGDDLARETSVLADWGVAKIARMGGAGVKMLLYYHPDAPNTDEQEAVVRSVVAACRQHEVPFFLEPIVYSLDPAVKHLPTVEKRPLVIDAARRFSGMGVDILKAEFPINIADEPDEAVWVDACVELTEASHVPWVLLSGGVSFDDFVRQTAVSCRAGCSGVMVGRAVWMEAIGLQGKERAAFLRDTGVSRMQILADICAEYGRSWTSVYPNLSEQAFEGWYRTY